MASPVLKTYIQMRFADVDFLGHVNNVNQQHYFDLGKSDFYKTVLGIETINCHEGIITASTKTDYFGQIHPSEKIYVETCVEKIGTKSISFHQRIVVEATGEVKTESRSVMVAFDFVDQVTIPVTDQWRSILE